MTQIVIVSGRSGSGKTSVLNILQFALVACANGGRQADRKPNPQNRLRR